MDIQEKKKFVLEEFKKQKIVFSYTDAFADVFKIFNDFQEQYTQLLRKAFEPLQNIDLQGIEKEWKEAAESLGKKGWTLPMLMDIRDHIEMSRISDISEIDNLIEKFHLDKKVFEELKSDIINHDLTSEWRTLLVQCFDSYEQGNYLIVIPNLFTIFEGVANSLISPRYKKIVQSNDQVSLNRRYKKVKREIESDKTYIIYYSSIVEFIGTIFRYGDFDKRTSRFDIINRNWVLHGRDNPNQWQRVDALRLFIALHSLIDLEFLMEDLEEVENAGLIK
ncbi:MULTISPECIES: hypothetical protein [Bacillus cereus group]|uniref:Uncharacterized protein n=1 Tax=Bacillus cereus TaxID=1396 RepID=A0AAW7NFF8_BACCE|nr:MULTISPECIES: hypothetical protein [Bacillus cereus group]MDN4873678.1 hypothetical protein [Bacillus cereus]PFE87782.1 hypothetical protein CN320_06610 [Bacillus thuringiensis]